MGTYHRLPIGNEGHEVTVRFDDNRLTWNHLAGQSWSLVWDDGLLRTGSDSPYGESDLHIQFDRDENGSFLPVITGLIFNNELYLRQ